MLTRLRRWRRYRRELTEALRPYHDGGYDPSPSVLRKLQREARQRAAYFT